MLKYILPALSFALLAACSMSEEPNGHPKIELSNMWKGKSFGEVSPTATVLSPSDAPSITATVSKGKVKLPPLVAWWEIYENPELNRLVEQSLKQSPDLSRSLAQVAGARAILGATAADLWPSVNAGANAEISDPSKKVTFNGFPSNGEVTRKFEAPLSLSYEVDLFGRLNDAKRRDALSAEAALADAQAVQLALTATLTQTWLQLVAADQDMAILKRTRELRASALDLQKSRQKSGLISTLDVNRAEIEMRRVEAAIASLARTRSELENALAVITGNTANTFKIEPTTTDVPLHYIPASLPGELLLRRPDIRASEMDLAAAEVDITVARKNWWPKLTLAANAGLAANNLTEMFGNSLTWGLVGMLTQPLFDGGARNAAIATARAVQQERAATYSKTVLTAVQEVENALNASVQLDAELEAQQAGLESAEEAARLSRDLYKQGLVSYLDVIDAERTELELTRQVIALESQQRQAEVTLIRALGGSWAEGQNVATYAPTPMPKPIFFASETGDADIEPAAGPEVTPSGITIEPVSPSAE